MSRYYDIAVGGQHWTSHPGGPSGMRDPGALNVEVDITQTYADTASGQGFVRVWGVGLAMIQAANQFAFQPITVKGGMGAGLPLSNPAEAGVIAQGTVSKYFGNYEGVNQSIDFQITAGGYGPLTTPTPGANPKPPVLNGVLNWLRGQPLAPALLQTLKQMIPQANIIMNIQNIIAPQDIIGYHKNLYELGTIIRRVSQHILGGGAPGVSIFPFGDTVTVDDGSATPAAGTIHYQDLIGQPTWVDIATIEVKCVMRADIHPNQTITMPKNSIGIGQLTSGVQANANSFRGAFKVTEVRHIGNFRQPDGSAWVTVIKAYAKTPAATVAQ